MNHLGDLEVSIFGIKIFGIPRVEIRGEFEASKKEKDFKSSKNSRISIVLFRETIDKKNFEENVKSTWIRRMDREIG